MPIHSTMGLTYAHVPYAWSYADASERTSASGFVSGDIGKLAYQEDDDSLWSLTATTPSWSSVSKGREQLTANRTYYVSTTGSDSNNGLTSLTPFATIQKAFDVVSSIDVGIFEITIQLANGTYTVGATFNGTIGTGDVTLLGDATTPSNVVISTTSSNCILVQAGKLFVSGITFQTTTSGSCLYAIGSGSTIVTSSGVVLGTCANFHLRVGTHGRINVAEAYSITGGAQIHLLSQTLGVIELGVITVTLTGTPNFTSSFADAQTLGHISAFNTTFSGAATGKRYSVTLNAVINTFGGGANFFPGNVAGTTATGGQYA